MLDTQVTLALVAFLGTLCAVSSPIIMAMLQNRNSLHLKQVDWERQDIIAAKAEAAAARNASLIAELNQSNAEATKVTTGKLDVIHTLVNSTLTAAMQVALDGVRRELLLMQLDPAIDPALIESTKTKIGELEKIIDERNKQTGVADLQEQRAEAEKAGKAVGVASPVVKATSTADTQLGTVTEKVLAGEPLAVPSLPNAAASKAALKQGDAAAATVAAAGKTVDAAAATVDAMKKT